MESGTQPAEPNHEPGGERKRPAGAVGTVLLSIGALFGLALLLAGLAVLFAHAFLRDDDGFYTTDTERLESNGFAIITDAIDLGPQRGLDAGDLGARVRIAAESPTGRPVFVGIGPAADVERYLRRAGHSVLDDWPDDDPRYREVAGGRPRTEPLQQRFWAAYGQGAGRQVVDWDAQGGRWTALVANANADRGVIVDVEAGVRIGWIVWVGLGLALIGLLITAASAWGLKRRLM